MSQQRKMERRKQKKLHLLGGEERLQVKAGDNEPFGISKAGYVLCQILHSPDIGSLLQDTHGELWRNPCTQYKAREIHGALQPRS